MSNALHSTLVEAYPYVEKVALEDYKVRVVTGTSGTAAQVRVFVRSSDGTQKWDTVGVSDNIIEASWEAIVDSLEYVLSVPEDVISV